MQIKNCPMLAIKCFFFLKIRGVEPPSPKFRGGGGGGLRPPQPPPLFGAPDNDTNAPRDNTAPGYDSIPQSC